MKQKRTKHGYERVHSHGNGVRLLFKSGRNVHVDSLKRRPILSYVDSPAQKERVRWPRQHHPILSSYALRPR